MKLITVDIGNTQSVFGLWICNELIKVVRVSTSIERTQDEWKRLLEDSVYKMDSEKHGDSEINVIYSSVVPAINILLESVFSLLGSKTIVKNAYTLHLPFKFDYPSPETLGTDRIANSAAGVSLYGNDLIIADFGTAITFCVITSKIYRGGVIIPGLQAGLDHLALKAAQLPKLSFKKKVDILGKSTAGSILAGSCHGWEGMVANILQKLKHKIYTMEWVQKIEKLQTIATGGVTDEFSLDETIFDIIDTNLTLRGLYQIFKWNHAHA